jgi:nucleotide-binding universal stress UspA family protein
MGRQAGVSEAPDPIRRILVAVDGSEPAAHALQWAIAMARGMGAEVIAVFAIAPFQDLSLGTAGPLVPPQADPGGAPPAPSNMPDMHTRGPTAGRTTKSVLPWLPSTLPSKPLPQPVRRAQHFRVRTDRVDV